tara:strand:- start:479 stop:706 length:228 start_codon:yes stop_codon:yes gene_type:complete
MNFPSLIESFFLACPMCMSGAEGNSLLAANSAIGVMLVILCSVLMTILSFIIHLAKRARRYAAEVPGETGQENRS